jgi:hypothetical protein
MDPQECAVRAAAGPRVLTLAALASVALAAQCIVASLETAVSQDYTSLLGISLGVIVEALTCAGLWTLALQGRAGRLGRAGFGLARVQPIVMGAAMQTIAAALLAVSVMLLFFRPMLMGFLGDYFDMASWYFMDYFGMDLNVAPDTVFGVASAGFAILFVIVEMFALRYLLLARFVRKMRIMAMEGRPPRSYYGFTEVVSYLLGVGMVLSGIIMIAATVTETVIPGAGNGIVVVLEGVCAFYTGTVISAVGHDTAAVHNAAAQTWGTPQPPSSLFGDTKPIEGEGNL